MQTFRFVLLALVLAVVPVAAQTPQRGTLSANGAVVADTTGAGTASITVSGTYSGTLQFEAIAGPGTAAVAVTCTTPAGTTATSTTGTGVWICPVAAMTAVQVRMESYASGAAVVDVVTFQGGGAGGSAGTFEGEVSVSAQPATDPHYVRCSNGSAASPCIVTGSGTAGSAAAGVLTVQGVASMTPVVVSDGSGSLTVDGTVTVTDGSGALNVIVDSTTALTPGTAAANLGKAEDAAHANGDTGVLLLGRRIDTAAAASGSSGDYEPMNMDSLGRQWVNPGVLGIEDAAETAGGNLAMVGTVRRDTSASSAGTTGDNATLNTDANGMLWVRMGASDVSSAGGTSAADDADFTAGTTSFTPVGGFYQSTPTACTDGDTCAAGITTGRAVKVALANADGSLATYAQDATHDSAVITAGPQVMGAASSTYPTAVGSGDAVRLTAGLDGVQITRPHAHLGDIVRGVASITDGSSTSVVGAQGSGIRFCATTLIVSNSSATNVTVDIRDGTAGSVIAVVPAAANMGGAVVPLPVPLCTTANTIFAADPSASATTVAVTAIGFRTAQ